MSRLEKLDGQQKALLPVIRDEWLAHGLSTEPADREAAVEGVGDAYRGVGLDPPRLVIWLDSPMAGMLGSAMLQVGDQVGDQVWDQVGDQWRNVIWGQHDAGWLAFYDTFRRFGIQAAERLCGLNKVARSSGWWWPMEGAVVLTERPQELHRDDEGRLHNELGAAVLYPDGWGVWAIHGVRVTQQIVEHPETLTVGDVQAEENAEVRRVMVDRMGAGRYLREADARLVDEDAEWGKLWRLEQADDEPIVMVECINSTAEPDGEFKVYWLRVPPDTRTARAGLAWTFDVAETDYALEAQS